MDEETTQNCPHHKPYSTLRRINLNKEALCEGFVLHHRVFSSLYVTALAILL